MRKLFPLVLAILGIGAGAGAGFFLKPSHDEMSMKTDCPAPSDSPEHSVAQTEAPEEDSDTTREFVKMNNQFVVPVVTEERISSLVVVSLSLEVKTGTTESVYKFEPKLRDAFLQVLFDHANIGGFRGSFTEANNMAILRRALLEVGQKTVGNIVIDVLITEIARQDA